MKQELLTGLRQPHRGYQYESSAYGKQYYCCISRVKADTSNVCYARLRKNCRRVKNRSKEYSDHGSYREPLGQVAGWREEDYVRLPVFKVGGPDARVIRRAVSIGTQLG